jgi:hypothetical protein
MNSKEFQLSIDSNICNDELEQITSRIYNDNVKNTNHFEFLEHQNDSYNSNIDKNKKYYKHIVNLKRYSAHIQNSPSTTINKFLKLKTTSAKLNKDHRRNISLSNIYKDDSTDKEEEKIKNLLKPPLNSPRDQEDYFDSSTNRNITDDEATATTTPHYNQSSSIKTATDQHSLDILSIIVREKSNLSKSLSSNQLDSIQIENLLKTKAIDTDNRKSPFSMSFFNSCLDKNRRRSLSSQNLTSTNSTLSNKILDKRKEVLNDRVNTSRELRTQRSLTRNSSTASVYHQLSYQFSNLDDLYNKSTKFNKSPKLENSSAPHLKTSLICNSLECFDIATNYKERKKVFNGNDRASNVVRSSLENNKKIHDILKSEDVSNRFLSLKKYSLPKLSFVKFFEPPQVTKQMQTLNASLKHQYARGAFVWVKQ